MRLSGSVGVLLAGLVALACRGVAAADEPETAGLYEIKTDGSSQQVKEGGKGMLVLAIHPRGGAHISDEAPLKVELSGDKVRPDKEKLSRMDAVGKPQGGQPFPEPRFEVPFTAQTAGTGTLNAKVTFFVCSEKVCARQQKTVSLTVAVN